MSLSISLKQGVEMAVRHGNRRVNKPSLNNANLKQPLSNMNVKEDNQTVILGSNIRSPQWGIIGEQGERNIAIDLNQPHTFGLFGVQGGGKSYTLGLISEMVAKHFSNINKLDRPLATVIFHYSTTLSYPSEMVSLVNPNDNAEQIAILKKRYNAQPEKLDDVIILTTEDKVQEVQVEFPNINVTALKFSSKELKASDWKFLMGAADNKSTYLQIINRIMRKYRTDLTLEKIREEIQNGQIPEAYMELAMMRLDFAELYINESMKIGNLLKPGRTVIVDIRDELIEKNEALGLFVVLLNIFSDAQYNAEVFNKLIVFDECHKYIENKVLLKGLVEAVREMRHRGTSVVIASQDPPSVPISLIELSSMIFLHKFNSPNWLSHIQSVNSALMTLTMHKMQALKPGEAYVWANSATDISFTRQAYKIKCRPRITKHGGETLTAVTKQVE